MPHPFSIAVAPSRMQLALLLAVYGVAVAAILALQLQLQIAILALLLLVGGLIASLRGTSQVVAVGYHSGAWSLVKTGKSCGALLTDWRAFAGVVLIQFKTRGDKLTWLALFPDSAQQRELKAIRRALNYHRG